MSFQLHLPRGRQSARTRRLVGRMLAGAVLPSAAALQPSGAQQVARPSVQITEMALRPAAVQAAAGVTDPVDSLVARAIAANPQLESARERVRAAEARVGPAAARPDPMLMAGIQNVPLADPGFREMMTMKMLGISQVLPAPGKLAAARRVAEREVDALRAEAAGDSLEVARDVKAAYYDVAYVDRALVTAGRTRDVLVDLVEVAESRLQVGLSGQADVLRARVEAARLGDQASALHEERRMALARLNAALNQPSDQALTGAPVPDVVVRAAVGETPSAISFVSPTLGSRAAGSPLPSVGALQELALRHSPILAAQRALIAAQAARAELARLERRPDVSVSVQYGQRDGFSDMVSAVVSVPLPVQRGTRQDALALAARRDLAALDAAREQRRNEIRAEVARMHAQLERARTRLALTVKAILPQSRAALESAIAAYQAGRTDFITVLEAQAALFNTENGYHEALSDFARTLAELELVVGVEVLP